MVDGWWQPEAIMVHRQAELSTPTQASPGRPAAYRTRQDELLHALRARTTPLTVSPPSLRKCTQEREETDLKSLQAGKREREGKSKVKAGSGGLQRTEAKLQRHKHRRVSRGRTRRDVLGTWNE